jgi:hypothetical protein
MCTKSNIDTSSPRGDAGQDRPGRIFVLLGDEVVPLDDGAAPVTVRIPPDKMGIGGEVVLAAKNFEAYGEWDGGWIIFCSKEGEPEAATERLYPHGKESGVTFSLSFGEADIFFCEDDGLPRRVNLTFWGEEGDCRHLTVDAFFRYEAARSHREWRTRLGYAPSF